MKPSKDLNREKQLNDYYKNFASCGAYYFSNNSDNKDLFNASAILDKTIKTTKPADYTSTKFIASAANALANQFTSSTSSFRPESAKSGTNSRLSSAKSTKSRSNRALSNKQPKPAWDDRW